MVNNAPVSTLTNASRDTEAISTEYKTGNSFHLLSGSNGTFGVGGTAQLAKAIDVTKKDNEINASGMWAEQCADEATLKANHVATCSVYIGTTGAVSYINTCDTGYNIEGQSSVNAL